MPKKNSFILALKNLSDNLFELKNKNINWKKVSYNSILIAIIFNENFTLKV